jgi:hypothetical protein
MDRRDEAIALRLRKGEAPPTTMPWKKWHDLIRQDIGAKPADHGCSDVTIEKMTRAIMRRFGR